MGELSPFFLYNLRNKILPGIIPVERRCCMVLNAQQKVKEKVLEKVIAQDQFSDGFRSLRDIFNQSKNDGFVEDFVDTILLSDYTNLKKAQSKNGTKNIPFIDNSKKLTGYDPTDFMINTLIDNKDDDKDVVHDGVVDDFLSRLKNSGVDRTAARLKNTSIEFDDVNKTLSVKSFTIGDSGAEVDDQDYDSPFSNDKYYISNIRKLFLNFLKENNNKIPFVEYNANIYLSSSMNIFFVKGKDVITVYGGQESFRKDYLGWAVDYNFRIFLWQFYKNLEKFHKNNSEIFKIYIGLNNKKLSLENLNDDDYVLISTIDKREVGFRKVLLGYLWKDESIDNLRNFFINRIKEDFEVYLTNILESDYNLDNVYKKEVPLSILSDSQIINSVKKKTIDFRSIDLHILKIIKDNCHDPKQFSRLMNLIEENL